jgi:hypothetical protein
MRDKRMGDVAYKPQGEPVPNHFTTLKYNPKNYTSSL